LLARCTGVAIDKQNGGLVPSLGPLRSRSPDEATSQWIGLFSCLDEVYNA